LNLCNGWAARERHVELVVANGEGPLREQLDPRVHLTDLGKRRLRASYLPIVREIRRTPDVPVLLLAWDLAAGVMLARRCGMFTAPTIYREGSCPIQNVHRRNHWIYRRLLARADAVIAQSRVAGRELAQLGIPATRLSVIPNPCPTVEHPSVSGLLDGSQPLILAVGRLSCEKAFDRLIAGFAGFHGRRPGAKLVILGEGPERPRLEGLIASLGLGGAVELRGFVEVPGDWYRRAHVFVLSSKWEGQSNALLEAIIHGCRVVALDGAGGTGELMREAGLGTYVLSDEAFDRELPSVLERALAEPDACWLAAARRVGDLTAPAVILERYWQVCQSVRRG
jgi:glycosyltransferase involved in cell wall biosynthesis